MAKNSEGQVVPYYTEGLKWSDGSVTSDLPMHRLSELFNVNHFMVSQVNPHVIPFAQPLLSHRSSRSLIARLISFYGTHVRNLIQHVSPISSHSCCRSRGPRSSAHCFARRLSRQCSVRSLQLISSPMY